MQPFTVHTGRIAPLDNANVDTDQIIPKQFLKSIRRTGFGESCFFDWRYLADGRPNPDFALNAPRYQGASVLVTRNNFGCGSSREHAVWAVMQYGFRAVLAPWREENGARVPGFADIFRNNSAKNGLLLIELSEAEIQSIFDAVAAHEGLEATVDLRACTVTLQTPAPRTYRFEVDPVVREALLNGLDDITSTLQYEADITAFETRHNAFPPPRKA